MAIDVLNYLWVHVYAIAYDRHRASIAPSKANLVVCAKLAMGEADDALAAYRMAVADESSKADKNDARVGASSP